MRWSATHAITGPSIAIEPSAASVALTHFFGRKSFDTGDESRNLLWLAPLSFGESWHNNHHAFPTSARHGLKPWEIDISAGVIWTLEKLGLAWDVVKIPPERQARKAVAAEAP